VELSRGPPLPPPRPPCRKQCKSAGADSVSLPEAWPARSGGLVIRGSGCASRVRSVIQLTVKKINKIVGVEIHLHLRMVNTKKKKKTLGCFNIWVTYGQPQPLVYFFLNPTVGLNVLLFFKPNPTVGLNVLLFFKPNGWFKTLNI